MYSHPSVKQRSSRPCKYNRWRGNLYNNTGNLYPNNLHNRSRSPVSRYSSNQRKRSRYPASRCNKRLSPGNSNHSPGNRYSSNPDNRSHYPASRYSNIPHRFNHRPRNQLPARQLLRSRHLLVLLMHFLLQLLIQHLLQRNRQCRHRRHKQRHHKHQPLRNPLPKQRRLKLHKKSLRLCTAQSQK